MARQHGSLPEKVLRYREMHGAGLGRGLDSNEVSSLMDLLQQRKALLTSCELHWNTKFTEEQRNSLLSLREHWTKHKIKNEHLIHYSESQIKKWEFLRYRMDRGDFSKDTV